VPFGQGVNKVHNFPAAQMAVFFANYIEQFVFGSRKQVTNDFEIPRDGVLISRISVYSFFR
jgi:hypothetical protein